MKHLMLFATAIALTSTPALAAPCRDAKGHFAKCTTATTTKTSTTTTKTSTRCKDAKGRFAKCTAAGAHPA